MLYQVSVLYWCTGCRYTDGELVWCQWNLLSPWMFHCLEGHSVSCSKGFWRTRTSTCTRRLLLDMVVLSSLEIICFVNIRVLWNLCLTSSGQGQTSGHNLWVNLWLIFTMTAALIWCLLQGSHVTLPPVWADRSLFSHEERASASERWALHVDSSYNCLLYLKYDRWQCFVQ